MRPLAIALVLAATACNPAQVDPGPAKESDAAPAANRATPPEGTTNAAAEKQSFAATGAVPCITRAGWRLRDCTAGVVRNAHGSTIVTVFHPEGRSRDILFDPAGRATGVRTAEADGSDRQPFSARRNGRATLVRLGPERYEIEDRMIGR